MEAAAAIQCVLGCTNSSSLFRNGILMKKMSKSTFHQLYIAGTIVVLAGALMWLTSTPSGEVMAQPKPAHSTTVKNAAAPQQIKNQPVALNGSKLTEGPLAGLTQVDGQAAAGCVAASPCYAYLPEHGEPVSAIVRHWWPVTTYMTRSEMEKTLRDSNNLGKAVYVKAGQPLVIPGIEPQPVVEKSIPAPPEFEVRAVYMTGGMAGSEKGLEIVRRWRQVGGNAVVFDIKDSDGSINVPFDNPLAPHHSPAIPNLPKYVRFLHQNGMHAIARIALFRDENIAQHHSELAVHSRKTGEPWRENGKLVWSDPSNPKMQEYDLTLAKQVAASGVDEVQFDYVRFPAEGDQKDAKFAFEATHPDWTRAQVIADFLSHAYGELHKQGVLLSLDVFGIMAWQRSVDLAHTGQDIPVISRYCDVLSPMIYPSHFFGMDGYANPGDAPEHFISASMQRFVKATAQTHVVLRPWLQAFAWRTKTYSPQYIEVQVAASKANSGNGFLFWNARNDYAKPYAAMPEMRKETAKYLRGDELTDIPRLQAEHEKLVAERAAAGATVVPVKASGEQPKVLVAKARVHSRAHVQHAVVSTPAPKP